MYDTFCIDFPAFSERRGTGLGPMDGSATCSTPTTAGRAGRRRCAPSASRGSPGGEEGPRPGERFYDFVVYVRAFLVVRADAAAALRGAETVLKAFDAHLRAGQNSVLGSP